MFRIRSTSQTLIAERLSNAFCEENQRWEVSAEYYQYGIDEHCRLFATAVFAKRCHLPIMQMETASPAGKFLERRNGRGRCKKHELRWMDGVAA